MPKVQYVNIHEDTRITVSMDTPARMSQMQYWFKAARKAIPQIPDTRDGQWHIESESANSDYIRFDLRNREGQRSYVIIMRNMAKGLAA